MSRASKQREFIAQWGDLATYNAERARGIVHTDEWKERMAKKQEAYNQEGTST